METDKALYMSLAMVCKNVALDVVKRGLESWRKLCGRLSLGQGARDEEGEVVNGDVEEIRSNAHNEMTHGTCA